MSKASRTTEWSPERAASAPCRSALMRETSLHGDACCEHEGGPGVVLGNPGGHLLCEALDLAHGVGLGEVVAREGQGVGGHLPAVGGRSPAPARGRQ